MRQMWALMGCLSQDAAVARPLGNVNVKGAVQWNRRELSRGKIKGRQTRTFPAPRESSPRKTEQPNQQTGLDYGCHKVIFGRIICQEESKA